MHLCTCVWVIWAKVKVLAAQSCPTLWDPMDCSPPGSSVRGALKARILEWVVMPSSKESSCNVGYLDLIPESGRDPGKGIGHPLQYSWASVVAQMVNNLPAMWESWVLSLGWESPLEEGMTTHSSILALRIPGIEEPGGLQSMGSLRARHD